MSIYDGRYFRLNKIFLRYMGLWPHDSWKRYVGRTFYCVLLIVLCVPHIVGVVVDISKFDKLMEHLVITLYLAAIIAKMITLSISDGKIITMLDAIVFNYALIVDGEEKEILRQSADKARRITITYGALLGGSGVFYAFLPAYTVIMDKIVPLPTPRNRLFIMNGEFLVDPYEYYWHIYFWDALTMAMIVMVVVSVDTMYVACTQHCVGLFAIIKHRLQKPNQLVYNGLPGADVGYQAIRNTIQLHQRVLQFIGILDQSYSQCFLALMLIHLVCLPTSSICILINMDEPIQFFRYTLSFTGLAIHQFTLHWAAQSLTDVSDRLFVDAYCNEWYASSPKTKKLLMIFLVRCKKPSVITAGGIMDMGMENFYGIMKKAISYITVFASFR